MKRNLIIVFTFILIFTYIVPPNNISYGEEQLDSCENIIFTAQTVRVDDDTITGKSDPSQQLTIEYKRNNEIKKINIDENGQYEIEIENDFLEINDEIIISNKYHHIVTQVVSSEEEVRIIASVEHTECIEINTVDEEPQSKEQDKGHKEDGELEKEDSKNTYGNLKTEIEEESENEILDKSSEDISNEEDKEIKSGESLKEQPETRLENEEKAKSIKDEREDCKSADDNLNSCSELNSELVVKDKQVIETLSAEKYRFELTVDVTETDSKIKITGKVDGFQGAAGGITVYIWSEKQDNIEEITVEHNGNFTLELDLNNFKGETLYFQAERGKNGAGGKSNTITQNVRKRVLELNVPSIIQFQNTVISDSMRTVYRDKNDLKVSIKDNKQYQNWSLSIKAEPLFNGTHTIDGAIHFVDDATGEILIENNTYDVAKKNLKGNETQDLIWGAEEGIILKLNPIQAQTDKTYHSTITWILNDAPQ